MVDRYSNEAVAAKTGHEWDHWFEVLDRFGAARAGHTASAKHLRDAHGVSGWWSQMLTVQYERDRGLREVGQKSDRTWQVSLQRTIEAPVGEAWEAFTTSKGWNHWFTTKARVAARAGGRYSNADGDKGEFRRVVKNKLLRFTWDNAAHCSGTLVEVTFESKGRGRCVVRLQHSKLPDKAGREGMKEGWTWALSNLKQWLETGTVKTFEAWKAAR